jgi:hypothetical protein
MARHLLPSMRLVSALVCDRTDCALLLSPKAVA